MTSLGDSLIAVLVVGLLNALIIAGIRSVRPEQAGRFLSRVFVATLLLRSLLAVALNIFAANSSFAAAFWGDSGTYDGGGDLLARSWRGEAAGTPLTESLSGWGFVYVVGGLYYVFGRNQLLVQLLNCTVGSLTVLVVYGIAVRLFGRDVGQKTAFLMAFFPQMIFWSAGMYKDPMVLLCIALCMYAVVCLREAFSPVMVVLFVGSALALLTLRFYIFYFVVVAALGTFVFAGKGGIVQRVFSYGVLTAALAGAVTLGVRQETLSQQAAFMTFNQMQVTRTDQATLGRSAYGASHDVTTSSGALRALPVGLIYLLFAPFPWAVRGVRQLLTLPETLVWYGLMPAFVVGLVHAVRHRLRDVLPILVFTVTLTMAYALMQGNIGTAYRQRTQVSMFFFVFMAVGLHQKQVRRAPVSEHSLPGASPVDAAIPASEKPAVDHDFLSPEASSGAGVPEETNARRRASSPGAAKAIKDDDFVFSDRPDGRD